MKQKQRATGRSKKWRNIYLISNWNIRLVLKFNVDGFQCYPAFFLGMRLP